MMKKLRPEQEQKRQGKESKLKLEAYTTLIHQINKVSGKEVLITGGDSGIGTNEVATSFLFLASDDTSYIKKINAYIVMEAKSLMDENSNI
jgi:hypothetical protein